LPADRYYSCVSEHEARAFIEGVEFVNDSALEIQGLYWIPETDPATKETSENFVVHLIDQDKPDDESEVAPDGFDSSLGRSL
jgi:hypothetical protein